MSLHYDWNWVRFYEQQPSAPMTLNAERLAEHEATLEALRGLSFEAGLSVIANSVPHMSDDVWADWYELLREDAAQHYANSPCKNSPMLSLLRKNLRLSSLHC